MAAKKQTAVYGDRTRGGDWRHLITYPTRNRQHGKSTGPGIGQDGRGKTRIAAAFRHE